MNTWKIILATMVIFGTGVVTGGLLVRLTERPRATHAQHAAQPRNTPAAVPASAGGVRLEFLRRAQRELDLTAGQRERVDQIIKESQERTRKLMEPVAPQLREEVERTRKEFLAVLLPEQRARFEAIAKQQQQRKREQSHPSSALRERAPEATATNGDNVETLKR